MARRTSTIPPSASIAPVTDAPALTTAVDLSDPRPIAFSDDAKPVRRPHPTAAEVIERLNEVIPVPARATADIEEEQLAAHQARYTAWQLGLTFEEIAEAEGAPTILHVRRSCFYMLAQLGLAEQIQARSAHTIARAHAEQADIYFSTLKTLFNEKSWMARSSALKHWRNTIMPQSTSIAVNIDNRKQTAVMAGPRISFETAMVRVRRQHEEDHRGAIEAKTASDAALLTENAATAQPETLDAVLVTTGE